MKYSKTTCSILGLQGTFLLAYIAGIKKSEIYNEIVVFEVDQAIYLWKEIKFRKSWRSLTEISKVALERLLETYKKMDGAPIEKSKYRKIYFDSDVEGGSYYPLVVDKNTKFFMPTNNYFRMTIEKMLADQ